MGGLIDFIFDNIAIEQLSRSEVKSYTAYLSEIFQQNLSVDQKIRYQRIKICLNERLLVLDKQDFEKGFRFLNRSPSFFLPSATVTWMAEHLVEWC